MTLSPTISIIVPNYQGRSIFPACIDTLLAQDFGDFQIVFCDDGSTDGSLQHAKELYGRNRHVTIVGLKRNAGYVSAVNFALRHCKGRYIMVTNNDATYPKGWMRQMYACVHGKKNVIGGSLVVQDGNEQEVDDRIRAGYCGIMNFFGIGSPRRRLMPEEKKSGLLHVLAAGIFIVPRSALTDYIFAQEYFAYGEDIELCLRLRLKGYSVVVNKRAKMHHLGSFTRKKVAAFNRRALMHGTKNTITNFFVFFETATILRLLAPFLLLQLLRFLAGPRAMWQRLKAYWWVLTHARSIYHRRQEVQRTRTVDDHALLQLYSYKYDTPTARDPLWKRLLIHSLNTVMYVYCKLVGLRTLDINDDLPMPHYDIAAVKKLI